MPYISLNPANGNLLQSFEEAGGAEIETALSALAERTFRTWRTTDFAARAAKMRRAAEILEEDRRRFGEIMTLEMGKPIGAAVAEVEKCASVCRYYAEHAADLPRAAGSRPTPAGATCLRPARLRAGGDAVELPLLAGVPLRRAGPDGRQRRLLKHASNVPQSRARHRGGLQPRRLPRGLLPRPCSSAAPRSRRSSTTRASRP